MFRTFFSKSHDQRDAHALYGKVVARSRDPRFYGHFAVPDTLDGRFEVLVMHLFMLLHRLKNEKAPARAVSQGVFDSFIDDMDIALREVAVGDQIVPKRIKKMTRVFYGRTGAYETALEETDRVSSLAEVLSRNLCPDLDDAAPKTDLATYMAFEIDLLAGLSLEEIISQHRIFEGDVK